MFNKYKWYLIIGTALISLIVINKKCENEPKTVIETETKTVIKTEIIRDTIIKTVIKEVPKIVYINNDKSISEIPTNNDSKKANQYNVSLSANNATASLKITTTGELLDVSGVIEYPKETITNTITNTITKTVAKSGGFLYVEFPISKKPERIEVGIDYQIKNTILIGISADYNDITKKGTLNGKLGIKIF